MSQSIATQFELTPWTTAGRTAVIVGKPLHDAVKMELVAALAKHCGRRQCRLENERGLERSSRLSADWSHMRRGWCSSAMQRRALQSKLTQWTAVSRLLAASTATIKVALANTTDVVRVLDVPHFSRQFEDGTTRYDRESVSVMRLRRHCQRLHSRQDTYANRPPHSTT